MRHRKERHNTSEYLEELESLDTFGKSESDLNKGSLQSRNKFNPRSPENRSIQIKQRDWTHDTDDNVRLALPGMKDSARLRALNKLSAKTHVRKDPKTGERLFLMHRGMGNEEFNGANKDGMTSHEEGTRTSWTPKSHVADSFAPNAGSSEQGQNTVSAWIPESAIIHSVNQFNPPTEEGIRNKKGPFQVPNSKGKKEAGGRSVTEREEDEWIVEHGSKGFHHANLDALVQQTRLHDKINEKPKNKEVIQDKLAASEKMENDMKKGNAGDWAKEGYKMKVAINPATNTPLVMAIAPDGKVAGILRLHTGTHEKKPKIEHVSVVDGHHDKDLAAGMTRHLEMHLGKDINIVHPGDFRNSIADKSPLGAMNNQKGNFRQSLGEAPQKPQMNKPMVNAPIAPIGQKIAPTAKPKTMSSTQPEWKAGKGVKIIDDKQPKSTMTGKIVEKPSLVQDTHTGAVVQKPAAKEVKDTFTGKVVQKSLNAGMPVGAPSTLTQGEALQSGGVDKIKGGLADGKKPSDFNKKKLKEGTKVEMEHTSDVKVAREIAMDHLTEDKNYYKKLKTIEKDEAVKPKKSNREKLKDKLINANKKKSGFIAIQDFGDHPIEAEIEKGELRQAVKAGVLALGLAHGAMHIGKDPQQAQQARPQQEQSMSSGRELASEEPETEIPNHKLTTRELTRKYFVKGASYMPSHIALKQTIKQHPDLMQKYGHTLKLSEPAFKELAANHPKLHQEVGERYFDKLDKVFNGDDDKIYHAWRNGIKATKNKYGTGKQPLK